MSLDDSVLAFTSSLAPYMAWAKTRPAPAYDLAGSNLLHCALEDLPGALDAIVLTGDNADGHPPLLEAIAERYGTTPDRVASAPGAAGANFLAFATLVRPGDDVLLERPAYDPLAGALRLLGAHILRFDRRFEDGYAVDPDAVADALTPRTRLVVLTSPHNPSGALVSEDALHALARIAERTGVRVLVDEVYLDAVHGERPAPAAHYSDRFISTSSLTKSYGLSGLRSGWILASPEVAAAARRARDVVDGVGPIAMDRLALIAFRNLEALAARARAILEPNAAAVARFIEGRPELTWVRPAGGNVAFPRIEGMADTTGFVERLLHERGTAIVPGAFFEAPSHVRIAFGCDADSLERGLEGLGAELDRSGHGVAPRAAQNSESGGAPRRRRIP